MDNIKSKHIKMYMRMAKELAKESKDEKLKVGTIIVGKNHNIISSGYNGHTAHIDEPNQMSNGVTDPRVRHSEKNALMALTKCNESSIGATMVTTHACCLMCAIDIVDSGVVNFIYESDYRCNKGVEHLLNNNVTVNKL